MSDLRSAESVLRGDSLVGSTVLLETVMLDGQPMSCV